MHTAFIAKIDKTIPIEGANTIQCAIVMGETVIVSKMMNKGDIGVYFPAGLQIEDWYCKQNNLYRDKTKNQNQELSGFFSDNRNVVAQPFMKVKSEGYFAPLTSLWSDVTQFKVGQAITEVDGKLLCKKYVSEHTKRLIDKLNKSNNKPAKAVDWFYKHSDTEQFKHYIQTINVGDKLSFHLKRHGTSFRVGYGEVNKPLPTWKHKINHWLEKKGFNRLFIDKQMDLVIGTRNTIVNNDRSHSDKYRYTVADSILPFLKNGMTVYGEIVGWSDGEKLIMQKHNVEALKDKKYVNKYGKEISYSYGCKPGEHKFFVYRITQQMLDGSTIDYSVEQVAEWCNKRNIAHNYVLHDSYYFDGDYEKLNNLVTSMTERPDTLTSDPTDESHVSEGVIIRIDNQNLSPKFLKSKSYAFRVMEGIAQADESVDIEMM